MKKLVALVLALCMILSAVPAMAADMELEAWTTLYGSTKTKLHNIEKAIEELDGTLIYYGQEFSFNAVVGPRTKEEGYKDAMNGRGVEVTGGGVSQLATTLYLAVRDSGYIDVEPFKTYDEKFADWYVEDGADAIITDYEVGHDFKFTSWYDGIIEIDAWIDDEDDYLYCTLTFEEGSSGGNGYGETPIFGSSNKRSNIRRAAAAIDGITLERGDEFSFNDIVGPRTKEKGYKDAKNGRGAEVTGGGVAQVASTVYLAVKNMDCVSVDPVKTYGKKFVDGYVTDPADAVITDYKAGTDFSFTYWGYNTLVVEVYEDDDELICRVYEE